MGTHKQSSSKPKKYTDLKEFSGMPKQITKLLKSESDRGVILILASYLEELLGFIVRESCVSDANADKMLQLRRPAGDFDSKILLCTAFAFIHYEEMQALRCIQKMRNRAAHFDRKGRGFDVLFNSDQTIDQVANLSETMNCKLPSRDREAVRATFILSARLLATKLFMRIAEATRPKAPQTLKEIANKIRIQMKDTPAGESIRYAEDEAQKGNFEPMSELIAIMKNVIQSTITEEQEPKRTDTDHGD